MHIENVLVHQLSGNRRGRENVIGNIRFDVHAPITDRFRSNWREEQCCALANISISLPFVKMVHEGCMGKCLSKWYSSPVGSPDRLDVIYQLLILTIQHEEYFIDSPIILFSIYSPRWRWFVNL